MLYGLTVSSILMFTVVIPVRMQSASLDVVQCALVILIFTDVALKCIFVCCVRIS